PAARESLAGCIADVRICEVVSLAAMRAVHAAPEQLSLWSAAVKYFVPTTVERVLRELAVVYGARHYLRANLFQKISRDHAVVPLFDGSTAVNLEGIGLQLPRVFSPRGRADASAREAVLKAIFDMNAPLAPVD